MTKKQIVKRTLAGVFACAIIGTNALPAATQLPTLFPAISASAATSGVSFNDSTGVLTLSGNVSKTAIQNYAKKPEVKSVVAATGTTFPADCSGLFENFLCTTMDLSKANVRSVTSMKEMFSNCRYVTSINLNNWVTGSCKDMSGMFMCCCKLTSLDLHFFNTANVENMCCMFGGCHSLNNLNISSFNTKNCKIMRALFSNCRSLKRIHFNVYSTDTSKVTDMSEMFLECNNLEYVNLSALTSTANVTNMRYMFSGCFKLEDLDLSRFNTAKVTNMYHMFGDCSNLTELDLSSFNTANVTNMSYMFYNCRNLEKIYTSSGFKTDKVKVSNDMFRYCYNIEGWQGTTYDPSWTAKESARWDIRPRFRGYFSVK